MTMCPKWDRLSQPCHNIFWLHHDSHWNCIPANTSDEHRCYLFYLILSVGEQIPENSFWVPLSSVPLYPDCPLILVLCMISPFTCSKTPGTFSLSKCRTLCSRLPLFYLTTASAPFLFLFRNFSQLYACNCWKKYNLLHRRYGIFSKYCRIAGE